MRNMLFTREYQVWVAVGMKQLKYCVPFSPHWWINCVRSLLPKMGFNTQFIIVICVCVCIINGCKYLYSPSLLVLRQTMELYIGTALRNKHRYIRTFLTILICLLKFIGLISRHTRTCANCLSTLSWYWNFVQWTPLSYFTRKIHRNNTVSHMCIVICFSTKGALFTSCRSFFRFWVVEGQLRYRF